MISYYYKLGLSLLMVASIPISVIFYRGWRKRQLFKYIQDIQSFKTSTPLTQVKNEHEFDEIIAQAHRFQIMSVDCEWVQKSQIAIALLQISFPNGNCYLVNCKQEKLPCKF